MYLVEIQKKSGAGLASASQTMSQRYSTLPPVPVMSTVTTVAPRSGARCRQLGLLLLSIVAANLVRGLDAWHLQKTLRQCFGPGYLRYEQEERERENICSTKKSPSKVGHKQQQ